MGSVLIEQENVSAGTPFEVPVSLTEPEPCSLGRVTIPPPSGASHVSSSAPATIAGYYRYELLVSHSRRIMGLCVSLGRLADSDAE